MPTRIDIELTSATGDGSWTWRAAGAREPKGVLDGSILPAGASVGDQLKAESDHDVDGIRILSIVPPKQKSGRSDVLELLPATDFEPVIQQRSGRASREGGKSRRRSRDERGDRDDRRDRGERGDRRGRRGGPSRDDEAKAGGDRTGRRERRSHRPHFAPPPELPQRPKPKRLRPGKQHLADVLASLPEEQRPVAELALQGMPAVRQRLHEDNARLKAENKPEMPETTVLQMAENLLPQLRVAEWLDRAEAAQRQLAHLDLRDLRSVVAAADDPVVARDESTRSLASELKAALSVKQEEELNLWLGDVEAAVEVGRVVRALRLSAMPPKAGVPFPSQLGARLGDAANASLTPDDPPDRWIAVLEAAAFSPVRTLVAPKEPPAQPSPELVATVTRLGPLLPQVAALFSIEVPERAPAPKPLRPGPPRKKDQGKSPRGGSKPARSEHGESPRGGSKPARSRGESPRGESTPTETTPDEVTPDEVTPTETTPTETTPTETTPDETPHSESTPTETTPDETPHSSKATNGAG